MTGIRNVTVIGLGYIGLPTAAVLAAAGFKVTGVDVQNDVVDAVNTGRSHLSESGLTELVNITVKSGALRASGRAEPADAYIIAVPTPITGDKKADMRYVESAIHSISTVLKAGDLVVLESTVPPRTCTDFVAPLLQSLTGLMVGTDFDLAYCPERVIPGNILNEIVRNDRIIGGVTATATARTVALYSAFVEGELLQTDATTAEMCKLMENTYRDVNVALANEFSVLAESVGVNIEDAIAFANHHPRVNIHQPGIGVGGHCIPVDPWFLIDGRSESAKLMRQAREINDSRPRAIAEKILKEATNAPGLPVVLLGQTYKADVGDMRESPALKIAEVIGEDLPGREIYVCEPFLDDLPAPLTSLGFRMISVDELNRQACLLVKLVPHSVFETIKVHAASTIMTQEHNWRAHPMVNPSGAVAN